LDALKERVAQRKGKPSIESLTNGRGSTGAGPSGKSKKSPREGGNIATTNRSPGLMLTLPLPHRSPIDVDSPPTDDFNRSIPPSTPERTMKVCMSPLSVLRGDLQFSRGVKISLLEPTR